MTFSNLLCYRLFGFAPYGFHLANIVLHAAVVGILYVLSLRMFRNRGLACMTAAIFALHPIHTEAVAWIAAVTDLELTFFYLLTFWLFLRLPRSGGGRSELTVVAMAGSFILALLSKEQAVTLPLLATLYEHFYREDRNETTWAQKGSRYRLLWLLAIAYILLRVRVLGAFAPQLRFPDLSGYQTVLSAVALFGQYLWKLLWPVHLCAFYVFHKSTSISDPRVFVAGVGGLLICAALFTVLWRRARIVSFALIWVLVTLAPVLNPQWLGLNVFTERYLYLPSIGFCWVVAAGIRWLWTGTRGSFAWHGVLIALLGILAAFSGFLIVRRNRDWQNDIVLHTRTLAAAPDACAFRRDLGAVYESQGKPQDAEREFRRALECNPDDADSLSNLGAVLALQGRYEEALKPLRRAIHLYPKHPAAHANLGMVLVHTGLLEGAELELHAGITLGPTNVGAYENLGLLFWREGRISSAENVFKQGLSVLPYSSRLHFVLGQFYAAQGQTTKAIQQYEAALENDPRNWFASREIMLLKNQLQ